MMCTTLPTMSFPPRPLTVRPVLGPPTARTRPLTVLVAASLLVALPACGDSDGDDDATPASAAPATGVDATTGESESEPAVSEAAASTETPDADAVATCLEDAGYTMVADTDLLSEQQVEDQLTAFGQVDGLTFDAATAGFAGSISFFETDEQAQERADNLSEAALELRTIGPVLISVAAGDNYDDAVAAAQTCLS